MIILGNYYCKFCRRKTKHMLENDKPIKCYNCGFTYSIKKYKELREKRYE